MPLHPYLEHTRPAVQHIFEGLANYYSYPLPQILQYKGEDGVIRMAKEEGEAFFKAYEAHFDLEIARAALAGSILQIAYSGLKQYCKLSNISSQCSELMVKPASKIASFCVGRLVKNIPIGLLIYAGRTQYNHWEEGELVNTVARQVFVDLVASYKNDHDFDLGYVLDYPAPRPVAHYIIRLELGWRAYTEYVNDMNELLIPDSS